jgi:hypothetical protein
MEKARSVGTNGITRAGSSERKMLERKERRDDGREGTMKRMFGRWKVTVLAVVVALVLVMAPVALAADGKPFILGKAKNTASKVTGLVKSGAGPALSLKVGSGPPLAVNSNTRVANLNVSDSAHADNADNATNAQNADNADKLDNLDASAFLPAGGTAVNADKVDGYHANELVRGSRTSDFGFNDNFNTCGFTTLHTRQVTAPTNGVLLVWGNVDAERDFGSASVARIEGRVTVDGIQSGTSQSDTLGAGDEYEGSVAISGAQPVAAGTRTVNLQLSECGPGMAFVISKQITTLFVPFGNSGSPGTLSTAGDTPSEPGQSPQQESGK